jgi:hypothetical protein
LILFEISTCIIAADSQVAFISDSGAGNIRQINVSSGVVSTLTRKPLLTPTGITMFCNALPSFNYGMIAYYTFDKGTMLDGSGLASSLVVGSASPTNSTLCVVASCLAFNGSRDESLSMSQTYHFGNLIEFSICLWFCPRGENSRSNQRVLDFSSAQTADGIHSEMYFARDGLGSDAFISITSNYSSTPLTIRLPGAFIAKVTLSPTRPADPLYVAGSSNKCAARLAGQHAARQNFRAPSCVVLVKQLSAYLSS